MKSYIEKIVSIDKVTHDVLKIVLNKPANYSFTPGQATEVSINKEGWKDEKRPFTFTCLPDDSLLEFTIKTYPDHSGVTNELRSLQPGDELIIRDVWGAITYKGEGLFIAGGAGVTPFIAIFRHLQQQKKIGNNKLIFGNKTKADIIYRQEFRNMLGDNFINILSDEKKEGYAHGMIDRKFLEKHKEASLKKFYVCGPPPMMKAIEGILSEMGVASDAVVVEL